MWKVVNLKFIIIIIILYVYLFQPPFFNKYTIIGVESILALTYLIFISNRIMNLLNRFKKELLILFFIGGFVCVRDLFQGEIIYSERILAWIFQGFILPILLCDYFSRQLNQNIYNPFKLLFFTSFIAAVLSWALFFVDSFDLWYKKFAEEDLARYENFEKRYRGYGISENIMFTYSLVMGFFSGFSYTLIKRNILYLLFTAVFLFALILNARIGLTVFLFIVLFTTVSDRDGLLLFAKVFISIIIIYTCLISFFPNIVEALSFNINWVMDFFYNLIGSDKVNDHTLNTLLVNFIVLPDTLGGWIYGYGESLFLAKNNNSDLGFILQLYYGGVIFILLIVVFVFYTFLRLKRTLGFRHFFTLLYLFTILVFNTKGFFFAATPGARLLFFLYIYFMSYEPKHIHK